MNINELGAMTVSSVVKSVFHKILLGEMPGEICHIKRVRDIKTFFRDTRQRLSVNGSVTLATSGFLPVNARLLFLC